MKKILSILIASLVLCISCTKEEDPVFDKSPEERLGAVLSDYKAKLTEGDGYWIAYYYGRAILMKFSQDNTVEFKSTYNSGNDDRTITYRVGSSQVPELVFENHSVFHAIYEDNRDMAEYEFLFDEIHENTIDFISKTDLGDDKTQLTFFKASPDDLETYSQMQAAFKEMSFFKKLTVTGSSYEADFITFPGEATMRTLTEDGTYQLRSHPFEVTKDGLLFSPAIEIDGVEVSSFVYDEANYQFITDAGGKKMTISVGGDISVPEAGIYNKYMGTNLRVIKNASYSMDAMIPELRKTVPRLNQIQLYSEFGYVLCYAPGTPGGNWGGFSGFTFGKLAPDSEQLLLSWSMNVFGAWWKNVYYNDGGQMLLSFLLDTNGLYIYKYGLDSYVLISNSDPSKYVLVE